MTTDGTTLYCGDNCNHTGPHRYPPTAEERAVMQVSDARLLARLDEWIPAHNPGPLIRWAAAHLRGCMAQADPSLPPAEVWRMFRIFEEQAGRQGSGLTRDQMRGAAVYHEWSQRRAHRDEEAAADKDRVAQGVEDVLGQLDDLLP